MTERWRLRRLHVENRLQELRSKYGRDLEDEPLPDWLDSLEGYQARMAQDAHQEAQDGPPLAEPSQEAAAPSRVLRAAEALQQLDRYQETPVFACPRCGEDSAKASLAIDVWHCTACGSGGKATRLRAPGAPEPEPQTNPGAVWNREPI